jgi:hypothetical protein
MLIVKVLVAVTVNPLVLILHQASALPPETPITAYRHENAEAVDAVNTMFVASKRITFALAPCVTVIAPSVFSWVLIPADALTVTLANVESV